MIRSDEEKINPKTLGVKKDLEAAWPPHENGAQQLREAARGEQGEAYPGVPDEGIQSSKAAFLEGDVERSASAANASDTGSSAASKSAGGATASTSPEAPTQSAGDDDDGDDEDEPSRSSLERMTKDDLLEHARAHHGIYINDPDSVTKADIADRIEDARRNADG